MMRIRSRALAASAIVVGLAPIHGIGAAADVVNIFPAKDNTLYEDPLGRTSNGAGQYFFAGLTNQPAIRRGLVQFDIAGAVPSGATIVDVSLRLHMSMTIAGPTPIGLHCALQDWGEGNSNAIGGEGQGAAAQTGDATWLHTFFDTDFWNEEGGDFVGVPSAVSTVDDFGPYTWASSTMIDDCQQWLDDSSSNFGWVVIGDEETRPSAKRFDSHEIPAQNRRPRLTVTYFTGGQNVLPASFEVTHGTLRSGDLDDLFSSDNNRVIVDEVRPTLLGEPSAAIEVRGTSPTATPQAIMFTAEASTTGFPTQQIIELFDYNASVWVRLDARIGPMSDATVHVSVTSNASRFVQAGTRQMRARIGYIDLDVTFIGWGGQFDLTRWRVFP